MSIDISRQGGMPPLRTRRGALSQLGRLSAAVALAPCIDTIMPRWRWEDSEISIAADLVRPRHSVLEADGQALEILLALLTAAAAVVTIFEYLGINPFFRRQVDYTPATERQCQYQFEDYHTQWANNGYQTYAGISRSPLEQPMICLSAADNAQIEQSTRVEMAGLYGGFRTVLLKGNELSVVQAAAQVAQETCDLSGPERARTVCIISRDPITVDRGQTVWRYCNAQGGKIWYFPENGAGGRMAVHVPGKTDPTQPLKCKFRT